MANTTTMVGFRSATLDTSAASQTLILDNAKRYKLIHLGVNGAGSSAVGLIKISLPLKNTNVAADAVADMAEGTDVLYLMAANGSGELILEDVGQHIKYIAMTGVPMFQIMEIPSPSYQ